MIAFLRRVKNRLLPPTVAVPVAPSLSLQRGNCEEFRAAFEGHLTACEWQPHPLYSVFTQYDQDFYRGYQAEFEHKYRCFYAIAKTIAPRVILELGTHAGSSADAYLSAAPDAKYLGFDLFGYAVREDDGSAWEPYNVALKLFQARGFSNFELTKVDLRTLQSLPPSDFVVVDGAHDYQNEYADLQLALTAQPQFIFVDDTDGPEAHRAAQKFLDEDLAGRVEWACPVTYVGGGLVIKLRA